MSRSRLPQFVLDELHRRGYRVDVSKDGTEERVIRPDGTVAIIASDTKGVTLLEAHEFLSEISGRSH